MEIKKQIESQIEENNLLKACINLKNYMKVNEPA